MGRILYFFAWWRAAWRGDVTARVPDKAPERGSLATTNAQVVCDLHGHTPYHGCCVVCYELVGDVTVEDALVGVSERTG